MNLATEEYCFQFHFGTFFGTVNDARLKQLPHKGKHAHERMPIQDDSKRKHQQSCIELLSNAVTDFSARNNRENWFRLEQN